APEGWTGVAEGGTQVALDVRITEALAQEGMAREVVRQVQELRKSSELEMEDRIVLYLGTESESLRRAMEAHKKYIMDETLAVEFLNQPLQGDVHRASIKIEGQALTIELKRVDSAGA